MSGKHYDWTKEAIRQLKNAGLKRSWFSVRALHDKDAVIGADISLARMPLSEMYRKDLMQSMVNNGIDLIICNDSEGGIRILSASLSKSEVGTVCLFNDGKFIDIHIEGGE